MRAEAEASALNRFQAQTLSQYCMEKCMKWTNKQCWASTGPRFGFGFWFR